SLQGVMQDLAKATQRLPPIAHNVEGSTTDLPSLLTQTQQTVHNLDLLITQMRGSWLLGGGGSSGPPAPRRLPTTEVRPGDDIFLASSSAGSGPAAGRPPATRPSLGDRPA